MPRVKAQAQTQEAEVEEAPKPRRGRRKAAPEPVVEAKPRRGRRKAAETEPAAEAPKKERKSRAKQKGIYTEINERVWDALPEGHDTVVTLGDPEEFGAPRGRKQVAIADFIQSRGRKKTTAKIVLDNVEEESDRNDMDSVLSHMINLGRVEAA
jgi:hypothetical protein